MKCMFRSHTVSEETKKKEKTALLDKLKHQSEKKTKKKKSGAREMKQRQL